MQDHPYQFRRGLQNRGTEADENRATAKWATNTMYLWIPADDELRMAIAVAHVQPEESLHNEWDASVINTVSHLSLAADDALERALMASDSAADIDTSYFDIINSCSRSVAELLEPMQPFVEAVDKFQILTVLTGDSAIEEAFKQSYAEDKGEQAAEEFRKEFITKLENEMELVEGKKARDDGGGSYVNPLYFHALSEIATTDWETDDEQVVQDDDDTVYNPVGRSIAEVVARVTLDIPNPIAPLGGRNYPEFDPLAADGVEPAQKSVSDLLDDPRYTLTEAEYNEYLGKHEEKITADSLDLGYEDARSSWVARVFIKTLQALEEMHEDEETDVASLNTETLQNELVRRVHDVDPATPKTMQDHPTVMFDVPRRADTSSQDIDIMSEEGKPLPKMLAASFEQDRPFAAVVYNLSEDERNYELNWHIKEDSFDLGQYQHIPEHGSDFSTVWHHYYVWQELLDFANSGYRDLVIDELAAEFESVGQLDDRIGSIKEDLDRAGTEATAPSTETGQVQSSDSTTNDAPTEPNANFASKSSPSPADVGLRKSSTNKESVLREQLLEVHDMYPSVFQTLAADVDLDPEGIDASDVECPVCDARSNPCGGDGECHWAEERERYAQHFPTIYANM